MIKDKKIMENGKNYFFKQKMIYLSHYFIITTNHTMYDLYKLLQNILKLKKQMTRQQLVDYLATVQIFCKTLNHFSDADICAISAQFNDVLDNLLQKYKSDLSEMQVPVFDQACMADVSDLYF